MKAYLVRIGSNPAKIALSADTAADHILKLAEARAEHERQWIKEKGWKGSVEIHTVGNVQELPTPLLKVVVITGHDGPSGKDIVGKKIAMEYRLYELDLLETPLEALAGQAE